MDTYYFDWSHSKIDVLLNDETEVFQLPSLNHLLDQIKGKPSRLIGEATFESFFRDTRRNEIIQRAADEGHVLLTTPTRATGKEKVRKYPPDQFPEFYMNNAKFPDNLAVDLIRTVAAREHLKVPRKFDPNDEWLSRREQACRTLMLLRNTKIVVPATGRRRVDKIVTAKDLLAEHITEQLPEFDGLETRLSYVLGNGSYSPVLVAAAAVASVYVNNTREFDKLSGLYTHGYPSQFRSDFHYWTLRFVLKRECERLLGRKLGKGEGVHLPPADRKRVLRDFRRGCRWMYHQVKELDVESFINDVLESR